jgi:hypothetical protein
LDLDRLNKLVAQWGNLVAAIAALVAAVTAIWTPLTTLNPWAWSWRELLVGIPKLRSSDQCKAFAAALKEGARRGRSPLSWQGAGLVYAAALLQPECADEEPTKQFVSDYQK